MQIIWKFTAEDVRALREFYRGRRSHRFVLRRRLRLRIGATRRIRRDQFWRAVIMCLLTTQQPSGPRRPVRRFLNQAPFPLIWTRCRSQRNLAGYARRTLRSFGGIRFTDRLSEQIAENFSLLNSGLWEEIGAQLHGLQARGRKEKERSVARFLDEHLVGFGPKQSRNLLQLMGLSRFEIPIDSRISKWLRECGFPLVLDGGTLSSREHYEMALDGLQRLCARCRILPCLLDAAVFSSFDED